MAIFLRDPYLLLLAIPLVIALIFLIKRSFGFNNELDSLQKIVILTRIVIVVLLVVALAGPFSFSTKIEQGKPSVILLADNSESMRVFDQRILTELKEDLDRKMPVEFKTIATGNNSAIGDGILFNIKGNDNLLIVSDGNSNKGRDIGDVILLASSLNATINTVEMEPQHNDFSLEIKGPGKVVANVPTDFDIIVNKVGTQTDYALEVKLDGAISTSKFLLKILSLAFKLFFSKTDSAPTSDSLLSNKLAAIAFPLISYKPASSTKTSLLVKESVGDLICLSSSNLKIVPVFKFKSLKVLASDKNLTTLDQKIG